MSDELSKPHRIWREWRGFILFVVIMLLFRSAVADWNQVPTGSMVPSILEGDRIVVDKTAYDLRVPFTFYRLARFGNPERSDIITFESPADGKLLIKRVIGIPGDSVELRDNLLLVNNQPASYTAIDHNELSNEVRERIASEPVSEERVLGAERSIMIETKPGRVRAANFGPATVPADHYLVLGDNRNNSRDSRFIGFIHRDLVLGKANSIAFSLDYENYYLPRRERFFLELN